MASISSDSNKEKICVQHIRKRILEDGILKHFNSIFEDRFLLHFVRGRKHNYDNAYKTLQEYVRLRTSKYKEFFMEVVPSQVKLQESTIQPFKNLGPNGEYIIVTRAAWWPLDDETLDMDDILSKCLLAMEEVWNVDDAEINGIIVIIDYEGFSLRHAKIIGSYYNIQKLIAVFYKAMPLRYRQLHYLNAPLSLRMIHNFAKNFMPAKFISRVHIHGQLETLHDHLPKSILPDWMGGQLTEDEAFDYKIHDRILDKDDYYRCFIDKLNSVTCS